MNLRLSFDLRFVGPRPGAAHTHAWCALNLATAFDVDIDHTDAPSVGRHSALLPWNVLDPANPPTFRVYGWAAGVLTPLATATLAQRPASHKLIDELRSQIAGRAAVFAEAATTNYAWSTTEAATPGDDTDDQLGTNLPWLALSHSVAGLPACLSQGLGARWFGKVALGADTDWFIIVPEIVNDGDDEFTVAPSTAVADADGRQLALAYQLGGRPDILAHVTPIRAADWRNASWLTVRDSRGQTLADIDSLLYDALDPAAVAAAPEAAVLMEVIAIAPPRSTPVKISGAVIAALRNKAMLIAAAEASSDKFAEQAARREQVKSVIASAPKDGLTRNALATGIRAAGTAWWSQQDRFNQLIKAAKSPDGSAGELLGEGESLVLAGNFGSVFDSHVDRVLPAANATAGDELPGKGIDFLIGHVNQRLLREIDAFVGEDGKPLDLTATYGVAVRRTSPGEAPQPWRLVTAGVPVLDNPATHVLHEYPWGSPETLLLTALDEVAIRGIALAFIDGVLRNDDSYNGVPMIGERADSFTNRETTSGSQDFELPSLSALAYAPAAPIAGFDVSVVAATKVPPLRDGDSYEIAAFIIDGAGGLPKELAMDDAPWRLDPAKLAALDPAVKSAAIDLKRRVPLGGANIQPGIRGLDGTAKASWPAPPAGVALRVTEWHDARIPSNSRDAATSLVLAKQGIANFKPGVELAESYSFTVEPPRVADQQLARWCLPSKGADGAWTVPDIIAEVARIKTALDAQMDADETIEQQIERAQALLPHDPAVTGIALRTTIVDATGTATRAWLPVKTFPPLPFLKTPLTVKCSATSAAGADFVVVVPPGSFAALEFFLLVTEADYLARFKLRDGGEAENFGGATHYRRFKGGTVLVESIAGAESMPDSRDLYDKFEVAPDSSGRAVVSVNLPPKNLAFVDSFELRRERWIWRNLPLADVQPGWMPTANIAEKERLLSSGLPLKLADATQDKRDTDPNVLAFDARAAIDRGFTARSVAAGRWPRDEGGVAVAKAQLLADDRDGYAAADYLRFELTAVSRYAPLYARDAGRQTGMAKSNSTLEAERRWRRVVLPVRNPQVPLRALNLRVVLPLTATPLTGVRLGGEAEIDARRATPFLAIFDEIWFREYGQGEALRAELIVEKHEIGETDTDKRPVRGGPLPDKHIAPSTGVPWSLKLDDAAAADHPDLRLDCFGPFGFSLDRSGNQALANATAFVVYVPDSAGPEWSMSVQFRRVLAGLASGAASPFTSIAGRQPTGAYPLYTIACSKTLAIPQRPRKEPAVKVFIDAAGKLTGDYQPEATTLNLAPFKRDNAEPPQAVVNQFRYLLQLGPVVADGGAGVDVFLPFQAIWLDRNMPALHADETLPDAAPLRGQILEIELNGNYEDFESFGGIAKLSDLYKLLLPSSGGDSGDAIGSIRRISEPIEILRA